MSKEKITICICKLKIACNIFFFSLLSDFWLIHLFYLHLLYKPYVGLCQATCVQSHQRQPTSAVAIATAIATCEVQVSAADYQTVPTVATGVSKPLCCRLTLTFTLTSKNLSLYITLLLLLVVIQLCSPRCWHIMHHNISQLKSTKCKIRFRNGKTLWIIWSWPSTFYVKTTDLWSLQVLFQLTHMWS